MTKSFVMIHLDQDEQPELAGRHNLARGYIPRLFFYAADGRLVEPMRAVAKPDEPRVWQPRYAIDERDVGVLLARMRMALAPPDLRVGGRGRRPK